MKHTIKICATILLALVLVLSVCLMVGCDDKNDAPEVTQTAANRGGTVASGDAPDGTKWTVYENGELAITGTPSNGIMYDYNKESAIPAWKAYANDVTGVTLDDSIKTIAADAFSAMKNIVWVQFGSGTENIGQNAFRSCSNLRRVVLPEGTKTIGANAFDGCYRMYEAKLPDSLVQIRGGAFSGCSSLLTVYFPKGEVQTDARVFTDSFKLIEVITENSTVRAGGENFGGVALYATDKGVHAPSADRILTNEDGFIMNGKRIMGYIGTETALTMPASATVIADYAFYANTAIKSVKIDGGVTAVGKNAFSGCTGLETLTIGAKVNNISEGAFNGCSSVTTLNYDATAYSTASKTAGIFEGLTSLTTVNFASGLKVLPTGAGLFRNCTALKEVTVPAVTTIPESMFEGCTSLEKVTFNAATKTVGENAFKNCSALTKMDLTQLGSGTTISAGAFEGCSALVQIDLAKVSKVMEGAFNYCKALTGVVIGSTFETAYGKQSFDGCTKLVDVVNNSNKSITAGDSKNGGVAFYTAFAVGKGKSRLTESAEGFLFLEISGTKYLVGYVGTKADITLPANGIVYKNAFSNNKVIKSVKASAGALTIGEAAFRNCTNLVSVDFTGSTISAIPEQAFEGCTALTTLKLSDSIKEIGEAAFRNTKNLGEVDLKNVETLNKRAFQYSGLTKLTAGTTLTAIPADAFSGCARMVQAAIPEVIEIGNQAFANCTSLIQVTMPKAETFGEYAFYSNTSLRALDLPAVETIAQGAFRECGSLMMLTLGENLTAIGESAFRECGKLAFLTNNSSMTLTPGEVGPGHVTRYVETLVTGGLQETDGYNYIVVDGKTYLIAYTGTETTLTLPATLGGNKYDIYRFAFWSSSVENVTVPEGVTTIGVSAFAFSALKNITIPASVTSLADSAFEGSSLRTITIASGSKLKTIGNACFKNCHDLIGFAMPDTVTSFGMSAFRNCASMRNITISGKITRIPAFAFEGCSSLAQIKLPDKKLEYGTRWCQGCDKLLEIWATNASLTGIGSIKIFGRENNPTVGVSTGRFPYISEDANGFVFFYDEVDCYLVGYNGTETDLVLPAVGINKGNYQIFDYAFYNRDDITSIRLSDRVTGIGKYAFAECDNLKGIYIPTTVNSEEFGVGEGIAWGCSSDFVLATGFASASALPASWANASDEELPLLWDDGLFNAQGPASAYNVVYGVTYDLFVTMLK